MDTLLLLLSECLQADPPLTLLLLSCKLWQSEEKNEKKRDALFILYIRTIKKHNKTLYCNFLMSPGAWGGDGMGRGLCLGGLLLGLLLVY